MLIVPREFRLSSVFTIISPRQAVARQLLKKDVLLVHILNAKLTKAIRAINANGIIAGKIHETALKELEALGMSFLVLPSLM
jgi:hypothetical protein